MRPAPGSRCHPGRLVAAQIVQQNDVASRHYRRQHLLDIGAEPLAVDRPIKDAGSGDAGGAQPGPQRDYLPMTVRYWRQQPVAAPGSGLVMTFAAPPPRPANRGADTDPKPHRSRQRRCARSHCPATRSRKSPEYAAGRLCPTIWCVTTFATPLPLVNLFLPNLPDRDSL